MCRWRRRWTMDMLRNVMICLSWVKAGSLLNHLVVRRTRIHSIHRQSVGTQRGAQLFLASSFGEIIFPTYASEAVPNGSGAEEMRRQQPINCVVKNMPVDGRIGMVRNKNVIDTMLG